MVSDDDLTAEQIALYFKQLIEGEQCWRDHKHTLDLRPIYHRKEDRIRAHVLLSFLALLLCRVAETAPTTPGATSGTSSSASSPATSRARPVTATAHRAHPAPTRDPRHRPGARAARVPGDRAQQDRLVTRPEGAL